MSRPERKSRPPVRGGDLGTLVVEVYCATTPWHVVAHIRRSPDGRMILIGLNNATPSIKWRPNGVLERDQARAAGTWERPRTHEPRRAPVTQVLSPGDSYPLDGFPCHCRCGRSTASLDWLGKQVPTEPGPVRRVALPKR